MLQAHSREGLTSLVEVQPLRKPCILGSNFEQHIGSLVADSGLWLVSAPRLHQILPYYSALLLLANTILPWASEWLLFCELWLSSGEW
jgi:hypothetical protein